MAGSRLTWFAVRRELSPGRRALVMVLAFLCPLLTWAAVSYVPFLWHPLVEVTDKGGTVLQEGKRYKPQEVAAANARAAERGKGPATGHPANPVFLPAPHEVALGLHKAFTSAPQIRDLPWFHESIGHSIKVIFWGFFWSVLIGLPLGILCGAFDFFARLFEPFVDFIRYMPAPVFGALCVAIMGIYDAPKIAIIFIGTFFQMVLIVANTTRQVDRSLLEAAQTLGASNRALLTRVILPGALPNLYNDLRILLGWAWTYLIVAEMIGAKSGITGYIEQQGRYFNFDLVYAAILVIGVIGLVTDQTLQFIGRFLFPWQYPQNAKASRAIWRTATFLPRTAARLAGPRPASPRIQSVGFAPAPRAPDLAPEPADARAS